MSLLFHSLTQTVTMNTRVRTQEHHVRKFSSAPRSSMWSVGDEVPVLKI